DSIAPADDSPVDRSKCKTEARAEIFLVHGKDRAWKFDAGASPAWRLLQALQREELRRAFGVASGTAVRIDQCGDAVTRVFGRDVEHVTQTHVDRQLRTQFPVVLHKSGILGRAEVVREVSHPPSLLPRQTQQKVRERVTGGGKTGQAGLVR